MRKAIVGTAVAFAWCVAAPFAQQQPAPAPEPEPAHKVYVLTGCLEADDGAALAFTLTDAESISQATPPGAGESGAVGTSGGKSYELRAVSSLHGQGLDADALKAHVGHRVEVTVRPVDMVPAPAPASGFRPDGPVDPTPERFSVTEIERVSGTCSP